jgi:hypothetical protein
MRLDMLPLTVLCGLSILGVRSVRFLPTVLGALVFVLLEDMQIDRHVHIDIHMDTHTSKQISVRTYMKRVQTHSRHDHNYRGQDKS